MMMVFLVMAMVVMVFVVMAMVVMVVVVMAMVVMVLVVAIVNGDGGCGDGDGLSKERVE